MKKVAILILTLVAFVSCQNENEVQEVVIGNRYSISIPSFLTEVNNLNEDASLQYQHAWKEFYVIVIDENKEELQKAIKDNGLEEEYTDDLKGYCDLLLDGFEQSIYINSKSEMIDTLINKLPAKLLTISGRVDGIDAFYSLAFIEGKERYYQIMAWTLLNKEYKYKDKMKRMMCSFKEK